MFRSGLICNRGMSTLLTWLVAFLAQYSYNEMNWNIVNKYTVVESQLFDRQRTNNDYWQQRLSVKKLVLDEAMYLDRPSDDDWEIGDCDRSFNLFKSQELHKNWSLCLIFTSWFRLGHFSHWLDVMMITSFQTADEFITLIRLGDEITKVINIK